MTVQTRVRKRRQPKSCKRQGPYKLYLKDLTKPIPRTTFYRMRKKLGLVKERKRNDESNSRCADSSGTTKRIFTGAKLTKEESIVSILSLVQHHDGVNKATLADFLKVLEMHTPEGTRPRHLQSLYKFCKEKEECFKHDQLIATLHHVCPQCFHLFEATEVLCPTPKCGKPHYKEGTKEPTSFFVELNGEQQIKDFFTDQKFVEGLAYKNSLPNDGHIRDVQDGLLYKRHEDFFAEKYNLSLTWHTDGVQVYNSSERQLWPVQAVINELPPSLRFSKRHMLLLGLYYGPGKPDMNTFLTPIVLSLNRMYSVGFDVHPYGSQTTETCRMLTLACTMDLPAMSAVKNVQQFNGEYGCGICEYRGISTQRGRGYAKTYPYKAQMAKRRSKKSLQLQAVMACQKKKPVKGVKGQTVVSMLKEVDLSVHFLVDYMHGTCLGIMKRLLESWFGASNKKKGFYLGNHIKILNEKLLRISPPTAMRRYPKAFTHFKLNYKASEYRDLLFYILPVVKGILPAKYFVHLAMLVRGVYILCQDDISSCELKEASKLLTLFYKYMGKHYGIGECTINLHNLGTHMVDCVKLAGPLFSHSCFYFEDMCGQLGAMVTGPRNPVQQIIGGLNRLHEFRNAVKTDDDFSEEVKKLLKRDRRNLKPLMHGFKTASKMKSTTMPTNVAEAVCQTTHKGTRQTQSFARAERDGEVFTRIATKRTRHQDCFVEYEVDGQPCNGVIRDFLSVEDVAGGEHHLAVISPLLCNEKDGSLMSEAVNWNIVPHISAVKTQSDSIHVVPLSHLVTKLLYIPTDEQLSTGFVIPLPAPYLHN